jgi:hypothetical protein
LSGTRAATELRIDNNYGLGNVPQKHRKLISDGAALVPHPEDMFLRKSDGDFKYN